MRIFASVLCIALACVLAPAQSATEFQTQSGLVRVAMVSIGAGGNAASPEAAFGTILPDSSGSLSETLHQDSADALLEIYYLEKSTGEELRFPVTCSQVRAFLGQHPAAYRSGSRDERAVALVRDLSTSLRVRMKTPRQGGGK